MGLLLYPKATFQTAASCDEVFADPRNVERIRFKLREVHDQRIREAHRGRRSGRRKAVIPLVLRQNEGERFLRDRPRVGLVRAIFCPDGPAVDGLEPSFDDDLTLNVASETGLAHNHEVVDGLLKSP